MLTVFFEGENLIEFLTLKNNHVQTVSNSTNKIGNLFYSSYVSLIPVVMLFAYTKAFLILSIPALWVVTLPIIIALVVYATEWIYVISGIKSVMERNIIAIFIILIEK